MKKLKHFVVAFTLALILSISTLAGEMPGAGTAPPPPPPPPPSVEVHGEMPGAGITGTAIEIMLTVVENILKIF